MTIVATTIMTTATGIMMGSKSVLSDLSEFPFGSPVLGGSLDLVGPVVAVVAAALQR